MYPLKVLHWDHRAQTRVALGEAAETAAMLYVGQLCEGNELEQDGAFATGHYAGTGFMMIKRQTVERMIAAYPDTRYKAIHAYPLPAGGVPDQYALFDCMIDRATGDYLSEDFGLLRLWRALRRQDLARSRGALTHCGPFDFAAMRRCASLRSARRSARRGRCPSTPSKAEPLKSGCLWFPKAYGLWRVKGSALALT